MKTPYEIAVLRKNGALDDAYAAARETYAAQPDDPETLRIFGFVIADQAKLFATQADTRCLDKLREFAALPIPKSENRVYESMLWNIRLYLRQQKSPEQQSAALSQVFPALQQLSPLPPCKAWSALLHTILQAKGWSRLGEFAYWCGFDTLQADDFVPFQTENGKRIMSLAEQLDCKIGKYLAGCGDTAKIAAFIPTQQAFYEQHRDYTYPPYFLAEMYIAVGQSDEAVRVLKPFARKKANEFWVWELLAEAVPNQDARIAYFCRALSCRPKEEMAVRLYEKAAAALAQQGQYDTARHLIDAVCRIRQAHRWPISPELRSLQQQAWYLSATPKSNRPWIESQSRQAECLLFGHTLRPKNKPHRGGN